MDISGRMEAIAFVAVGIPTDGMANSACVILQVSLEKRRGGFV